MAFIKTIVTVLLATAMLNTSVLGNPIPSLSDLERRLNCDSHGCGMKCKRPASECVLPATLDTCNICAYFKYDTGTPVSPPSPDLRRILANVAGTGLELGLGMPRHPGG